MSASGPSGPLVHSFIFKLCIIEYVHLPFCAHLINIFLFLAHLSNVRYCDRSLSVVCPSVVRPLTFTLDGISS